MKSLILIQRTYIFLALFQSLAVFILIISIVLQHSVAVFRNYRIVISIEKQYYVSVASSVKNDIGKCLQNHETFRVKLIALKITKIYGRNDGFQCF